jgi:hypothetical protein
MFANKLMLNDFEILIWAIYLKETVMNRNDFIDYLSTSAMFVKKDLNEVDVFKIFETFFAHNHYDAYAKYASSSKPQVTLTLKRINYYNMTLLAPFGMQRDYDIQDFNYEVDALEDEHVRRDVHTTKVIADEDSNSNNLVEKHDDNGNSDSAKNTSKRSRKPRGKTQHKAHYKATPPTQKQNLKSIKEEQPVPQNKIQNKRQAKKSFDLFNGDDRSDNHSESPYSITPSFIANLNRSSHLGQRDLDKQPLLFSQINHQIKKEEKSQDQSNFPFGKSPNNLAPAIPPPFKRPMLSVESIGNGIGDFSNIDDSLNFNMIKGSMERMPASISREFMERNNNDHNDNKGYGVFKSFTPFASGEFGKIFDNNEQPRNLYNPKPKYQK